MSEITDSKLSGKGLLVATGLVAAVTALALLLGLIVGSISYGWLSSLGYMPFEFWLFFVGSILCVPLLIAVTVLSFMGNSKPLPWLLVGYLGVQLVLSIAASISYGQNPLPLIPYFVDVDYSYIEFPGYAMLVVDALFYALLVFAVLNFVRNSKLKISQPAESDNVSTKVSFSEAVRSGFKKYVSFQGRSTRAEYWLWTLFSVLVYIPFYFIYLIGLISYSTDPYSASPVGMIIGAVLTVLVGLGLFLPSLSVLVRRLHDLGYSGGFYFLSWIPFVGSIILFVFTVMPSQIGANRFGPARNESAQTAVSDFQATSTVTNTTGNSFCGECGAHTTDLKFCKSCGKQVN